MAFSRTCSSLALVGGDEGILLAACKTGEIIETYERVRANTSVVTWGAKELIFAQNNKRVERLDTVSKKMLLLGGPEGPSSISVSENGVWLCIGCEDGSVIIYKDNNYVASVKRMDSKVSHVMISDVGNVLAGDELGVVAVWSIKDDYNYIKGSVFVHSSPINCMELCDTHYCHLPVVRDPVFIAADNTIRVWSSTEGKCAYIGKLQEHKASYVALKVIPNFCEFDGMISTSIINSCICFGVRESDRSKAEDAGWMLDVLSWSLSTGLKLEHTIWLYNSGKKINLEMAQLVEIGYEHDQKDTFKDYIHIIITDGPIVNIYNVSVRDLPPWSDSPNDVLGKYACPSISSTHTKSGITKVKKNPVEIYKGNITPPNIDVLRNMSSTPNIGENITTNIDSSPVYHEQDKWAKENFYKGNSYEDINKSNKIASVEPEIDAVKYKDINILRPGTNKIKYKDVISEDNHITENKKIAPNIRVVTDLPKNIELKTHKEEKKIKQPSINEFFFGLDKVDMRNDNNKVNSVDIGKISGVSHYGEIDIDYIENFVTELKKESDELMMALEFRAEVAQIAADNYSTSNIQESIQTLIDSGDETLPISFLGTVQLEKLNLSVSDALVLCNMIGNSLVSSSGLSLKCICNSCKSLVKMFGELIQQLMDPLNGINDPLGGGDFAAAERFERSKALHDQFINLRKTLQHKLASATDKMLKQVVESTINYMISKGY